MFYVSNLIYGVVMLTLRTRSTSKDYQSFFCEKELSFNDLTKLYDENSNFFLFVEIGLTDWKFRLFKLPSNRKSQSGQAIYVELAGNGHKGDKEACSFYNFISYLLSDFTGIKQKLEEVGKEFDSVFNKEYIDSLDDIRCTQETEDDINEKINKFFQKYDTSVGGGEDNQARNSVFVDYMTQTNVKRFLGNLYCICNKESQNEMVLICSSKEILTKDDINSFCSQYADKNTRITILLEKAIKELKFPYTIESNTLRINPSDKKKHFPGHLIFELFLFSLLIAGCIYFYIDKKRTEEFISQLKYDNEKISSENKILNDNNALQGTWIAKNNDKQVSLIIQGNICRLIGLSNYDIIYQLDEENRKLDTIGQLHSLNQIVREYDSKREEILDKYNKTIRIQDDCIVLISDEKTIIKMYKQN